MKVDSNVITGGYLVKNIIVDPLFLVNGSFVTFDLVSSHYAGLFLSSFGNDDNSDEMVGYPSGGGGGAGTPGAPGVNGLPGVRGADGNDGEDGERGFPGLQGAQGAQGGAGVNGLQGVATFLESEPGQDGDPGPPGKAGNNGTTGAQGPVGPGLFFLADDGNEGDQGCPGAVGPQGAAGGGGLTTLKTTGDQTINSGIGVYTDITGLTFPVVSGTDYAFKFHIAFRSAATTTGWKASVNHPGGTVDYRMWGQTIANAAAGAATHTERHSITVDDMTLLIATVTAAADLCVSIEGRYKCTANGTFAARFANELANTDIVVQKGSWGWYF